jgi:hypothetical protein
MPNKAVQPTRTARPIRQRDPASCGPRGRAPALDEEGTGRQMPRQVTDQLDDQIEFLHRSRSLFPHLSPSVVGQTRFDTAPNYQNRGPNISFHFATVLTVEFIEQFNDLGHWINQNVAFRLYAVLESNQLVSRTIRIQDTDGHNDVDILRRLRNEFGHGSGRYDGRDPEKRKLLERIVSHFHLSPAEYAEDGPWFPIPIDKGLVPLAEGSKRYAIACDNLA